MRTSIAVALVLCCACGDGKLQAQASSGESSPARVDEAQVDDAAPANEPVSCIDGWCQFPRFPPRADFTVLVADGSEVWTLDKDGIVAHWDGSAVDAPEHWTWWKLDGTVRDLWAGDGVAVAVGHAGFAARFESGQWTALDTGVTEDLRHVDGVAGGPVWISGHDLLLRLDQTKVAKLETPALAVSRNFVVEAASATEVWLASDSAWRWADGEWVEHSFGVPPRYHTPAVQSIDSSDPHNIWAVSGRYVYRWNGSGWMRLDIEFDDHDGQIDVHGPNDVVVYFNGRARHWDGRVWTTRFEHYDRLFDRLADGRIVSGEHALAIYDVEKDSEKTQWAHRGAGLDIQDIWVGETSTWLVGGEDGPEPSLAVARFDGKTWQRWVLDARPATKIAGFGDDPWILNDVGDVYHLVDDEWRHAPTEIPHPFTLSVGPNADAWVVSSDEWAVAHHVDDRWQALDRTLRPSGSVRSVRVGRDGTVMMHSTPQIGGSESTDSFSLWNGTKFERIGEVPFDGTFLVLARNDALVYEGDRIARWDGSTWTELTNLPIQPERFDDVEAVGARLVALTDKGLLDLQSGVIPPAPFMPDRIFGGTSGQLWVTSHSLALAFRQF